jgi:hypothetical protein
MAMGRLLQELERVPAVCLDVTYQALEPAQLEPFAGHVLHGGLGRHLRQAVCFDLELDCRLCPARHECLFPPMFGPGPGAQAVTGAARPYVLSFPGGAPLRLDPGEELAVRVLVLGPAASEPEITLGALMALGRSGLGLQRGRCRVLTAGARQVRLGGTEAPEAEAGLLRIQIASPLRALVKGRLLHETRFADLVRMALRRVVSVVRTFAGGRLEREQWTDLARQAERVALVASELQRVGETRMSFSTRQVADVSGLIGTLVVGQGWEGFYPLLAAAAPLGLGKGTGMGYGQVVLRPGGLER